MTSKQNQQDNLNCRTGCNCRKCGVRTRNRYDFEHDDEADEVLTAEGVKLRETT